MKTTLVKKSGDPGASPPAAAAEGKFLWADCWTNGKAVRLATVSGKREDIEGLHAQAEKTANRRIAVSAISKCRQRVSGSFFGLPTTLATGGNHRFPGNLRSAMKERERALQEDNSSYELVDPAVGLQPTKKVVAKYIYPDGTGVTDWYGFGKAFG